MLNYILFELLDASELRYDNERKLLLAKKLILGGEMSLADISHYL